MKISKRLKTMLPPTLRDQFRMKRKRMHFLADGVGVRHKNLGMFEEDAFKDAWAFSLNGNKEGWSGSPPDIRWRAHVCCWAAKTALHINGDFVECGVHTGLLSMAVCRYLDFSSLDKEFILYDTFEGIPASGLSGSELKFAEKMNTLYSDVYDIASRNFSEFQNVKLVKGHLPDSLNRSIPERIAYLSIDLNSSTHEKNTIEKVWPNLVSGAIVVIDDYAFSGHESQYEMWNDWARTNGTMVLTLPTGQGLLVKP